MATATKLKGNVKRYKQPKFEPFLTTQDELVRLLIKQEEFDDTIEQIDDQQCTIKNHKTIFLATLTHRYKIGNRHYYGVEVKIPVVGGYKICHRYVTTRELKLVDTTVLDLVKEGTLELA